MHVDPDMMDDEKIIFSDERDDTTCLNVCEMLLSDVKAFWKIISSLDDKEFRRSLRFPRTVTKNDDVKIHSIFKEISALK